MAAPIFTRPKLNLLGEEKKEPTGGFLAKTGEALGIREAPAPFLSEFSELAKAKGEAVNEVRSNFDLKLNPVEPPGMDYIDLPTPSGEIGVSDVVNFMFGSEMAILGFKADSEGLDWDWNHAVNQWSEEPMWLNLLSVTSLAGSIAFPALKAVTASAKFGAIGGMLGKFGDRAAEIQKFKTLGAIAEDATDVSDATLKGLRRLEHARSKYMELSTNIKKSMTGETINLTPLQRLKFAFDQKFANQYFKMTGAIPSEGRVSQDLAKSLQRFWREENLGRFFVDIPDDKYGIPIYAHWMKRNNPDLGLTDIATEVGYDVNKLHLPNEVKSWADNLYEFMVKNQEDHLLLGTITPETVQKVGAAHVGAFLKKTPEPEFSPRASYLVPIENLRTRTTDEGVKYIALKAYNFPRLEASQMKMRRSEVPEIARRLFSGQLITSPADLTFRNMVIDRQLLHGYKFVGDLLTEHGQTLDKLMIKYGAANADEAIKLAKKEGFISPEHLAGSIPSTLKRILAKQGYMKETDPLPFIHRAIYDEIFGPEGLFFQAEATANILHVLTMMHKTAKTVWSVPTHFQNLAGNFGFLAMAGYNPLAPESLDTMSKLARTFQKWALAHKNAKQLGVKAQDLVDPATKRIKGVNFGKITIGGKDFDLNDELLDPMVRELVEESAFEFAEGFGALENMLNRMKKGTLTAKFVKGALKMRDIHKSVRKGTDIASQAYLGEDMVPKLAYYLHLRSKGMSREWAALEVGRRLPMYNTVGPAIAGARRLIFPWATFPAEALRIMKNNMTDHPIRMLPWLQLPNILQTGFAMSGVGPSLQDVQERKRQLPLWAQTPTTVVTEGPKGQKIGAGLASGAVGLLAGGAVGGAPGAYLGGAVGAAAGSYLPTLLDHDKKGADTIRGAVLNWLPHSAFLPESNSPELVWNVQQILQQTPAEPLAILRPLVEIMSGQTAYGQELGGENTMDEIGKAIAGLVGFVAPPLFQKYTFRATTPDKSMSQTLLDTHVPGDISNVSRLLVDTGAAVDPITGKPGSLTYDFLVNNFMGLWKSYGLYPELRLANEARTEKALSTHRSYLARNLKYFIENGDDAMIRQTIQKIFNTFVRQYTDDPGLSQKKFYEYMQEYIKDFGRHPLLRTWSKEDLQRRWTENSENAGKVRSSARKDLLKSIEEELTLRGVR